MQCFWKDHILRTFAENIIFPCIFLRKMIFHLPCKKQDHIFGKKKYFFLIMQKRFSWCDIVVLYLDFSQKNVILYFYIAIPLNLKWNLQRTFIGLMYIQFTYCFQRDVKEPQSHWTNVIKHKWNKTRCEISPSLIINKVSWRKSLTKKKSYSSNYTSLPKVKYVLAIVGTITKYIFVKYSV